jgi:DNA-directed RNA polymerase alpha subunit
MAVTRIPLPDWARTQRADDRLELPMAETELSVRTVNCLEEQAIFTSSSRGHRTSPEPLKGAPRRFDQH